MFAATMYSIYRRGLTVSRPTRRTGRGRTTLGSRASQAGGRRNRCLWAPWPGVARTPPVLCHGALPSRWPAVCAPAFVLWCSLGRQPGEATQLRAPACAPQIMPALNFPARGSTCLASSRVPPDGAALPALLRKPLSLPSRPSTSRTPEPAVPRRVAPASAGGPAAGTSAQRVPARRRPHGDWALSVSKVPRPYKDASGAPTHTSPQHTTFPT